MTPWIHYINKNLKSQWFFLNLVPDFIVALYCSSCNVLFFALLLSICFLFLFIGISRGEWVEPRNIKKEKKREWTPFRSQLAPFWVLDSFCLPSYCTVRWILATECVHQPDPFSGFWRHFYIKPQILQGFFLQASDSSVIFTSSLRFCRNFFYKPQILPEFSLQPSDSAGIFSISLRFFRDFYFKPQIIP